MSFVSRTRARPCSLLASLPALPLAPRGDRGALLTGQLRISAQWEGLVSAGLPRWLCALLPGGDSAAGWGACGHLPHATPLR